MPEINGNSGPPETKRTIARLYTVVFLLLGIGASLECSAVMLSYTWGLYNSLDEWLSLAAACFIITAGAIVIFAMGFVPLLVFSAAFFFLLSRGLNITRATVWLDSAPLIGMASLWSKILENMAFTLGALLMLASFVVAAIEAHRARRELAGRHQALLDKMEARKSAVEEWRKSEQNALAILNATTDVAFLMQLDGTILALNNNFAKTFKKSVEELLHVNVFDLLPPELVQSRKKRIDEVVRTGQPVRFKDQRFGHWIDNSVYPLLDNQGNVVRLAAFGRDITNEVRLETQMRQSQKMQALGRLAGGGGA